VGLSSGVFLGGYGVPSMSSRFSGVKSLIRLEPFNH